MLKVTLNRLKHQVEQIISEAESRAGKSTTRAVRASQRCPLSPTLFDRFFFECIIRTPLEDQDRKSNLDVRCITNLRFADDTVGLAEEMQE